MDKEAARRYMAGYEAANRITVEEARALSAAERFRRFLDFRDWLEDNGLLPTEDQDMHFYETWAELQRRYLERTKAV